LLSSAVCSLYDYILVFPATSWSTARNYCQLNYDDLAMLQTVDDWSLARTLIHSEPSLAFNVWIGLIDSIKTWQWSFLNEAVTFVKWDLDQPNNLRGNQFCGKIRSTGDWWDENCNVTCAFFCQTAAGSPVLISDPLTTWSQAQLYCRANYTDLITVRNSTMNQQLKDMMNSQKLIDLMKMNTCAWIGIYRDAWKWLNGTGSNLFYSLPWAPGQPDNYDGAEECSVLDYNI
ncbi:hypothetical protein DNTS_021739, partial [Danionella cerebrum]